MKYTTNLVQVVVLLFQQQEIVITNVNTVLNQKKII